MINKTTLGRIKKFALEIDWQQAFAGRSKGNKHLSRVVKIAIHIANHSGADLDIVAAGAWLHDLALPAGDDYNYKKSKQLALRELGQFKLTSMAAKAVAECIASHEGLVKPASLEAQIVHDADVLDKSGLLGIIRQTWKLVHLGRISSQAITHKEINEIVGHLEWRKKRLGTAAARKLYKRVAVKLDKKFLQKIVPAVAVMAEQGLITEVIAQRLARHINLEQRQKLASQLDLSCLS